MFEPVLVDGEYVPLYVCQGLGGVLPANREELFSLLKSADPNVRKAAVSLVDSYLPADLAADICNQIFATDPDPMVAAIALGSWATPYTASLDEYVARRLACIVIDEQSSPVIQTVAYLSLLFVTDYALFFAETDYGDPESEEMRKAIGRIEGHYKTFLSEGIDWAWVYRWADSD